MIDFITALKAKIPYIGIHTDDPVSVKEVLQSIAQKSLYQLPALRGTAMPIQEQYLWWTENPEMVTVETYKKLQAAGASAVVINPTAPMMLVFDVGVLPTPEGCYTKYLLPFVTGDQLPGLLRVLQGLSPKSAQEVVQLTMARCGSVLPHEIRKTRQLITGEHPGLSTLDTDYDFYEMPKSLKDWLDLNDSYFLNPDTPMPLVPRGLLLAGDPGVGKSMAARVLAKHWDVPLFRLDVSTSLNRYLGESEGRIARSLTIIEQNAPCVWLLDEAEKLFGGGNDEGTSRRILGQILWWLQAHKSRVLTIMTTNDLPSLPKELYRAERLDRVIHLEKLSLTEAKIFASKVYRSVFKDVGPPMKRQKIMREALDEANKGAFAHAEVRVLVYELIKSKNWLTEGV